MNIDDQLKFPIGKYKVSQEITADHITQWAESIKQFPQKLSSLVEKLSAEELNYVYRPEGWNIKQVIHHLADSHVNSFTRFKLTLTEENPTIRPYEEALWAETEDANNDNTTLSLNLLEALHSRWSIFLKSLKQNDFDRTYYHPADNRQYTLKWMLGLYAWHCEHHYAHIEQALKHKGQF